jgi:hypothetical protein
MIKMHDSLSNKLLAVIDQRVTEIMQQEDYKLIEVKNGEDYFRFVDKYELEINPQQAPTLKAQEHQYPLYLPYTKSVVSLNDLFGEFLEKNLGYWQFLLADKADFNLAY